MSVERYMYYPYELMVSLADGRKLIQCRDADGRRRTVCIVDSTDEWGRFVSALKAGQDEVAAVHAIDARRLTKMDEAMREVLTWAVERARETTPGNMSNEAVVRWAMREFEYKTRSKS